MLLGDDVARRGHGRLALAMVVIAQASLVTAQAPFEALRGLLKALINIGRLAMGLKVDA